MDVSSYFTCRQVDTSLLTLSMGDYWQRAASVPQQKLFHYRCSQNQSSSAFQRINNNKITRYLKKKSLEWKGEIKLYKPRGSSPSVQPHKIEM